MTDITRDEIFARAVEGDEGIFDLIHSETGMPVTRCDDLAYFFPVGSEWGCAYEHAEGIRLNFFDVVSAGLEVDG